MTKLLWKMIGVEAEDNGLGEIEYNLECDCGTRDVLYMLYMLVSILVPSVVCVIALNDGGIIAGIGSLLTVAATWALIPVLSPIIDGYYSAHKILW